jgi:tetratricopeptide (TPR) repeat protein
MCARFDDALACYQPALERTRRVGDVWAEPVIRNDIAVIQRSRKDFADAMRSAERALELCQRLGDRAREGDSASIVGSVLLEVGRYESARDWCAMGLAIHAETGSRWSRADTLVHAARVEVLAGDLSLGLRWLEEAIELARGIGARYVLASGKSHLAHALLRRRAPGDIVRAEDEASEAAALGREAALPSIEIQARSRAAWASLEVGDSIGARAQSTQAVERLAQVTCIEASEEEILYTHHRVLKDCHDPAAQEFLQAAFVGYETKLRRIEDPAWKKAFAAIELHRKIVEDYGPTDR